MKHHGSCICGDVKFQVELDLRTGSRCNCTMCTKLGATASIVKPPAFTLVSAPEAVSSYTRTPEIGHRFFCSRCHVYCFGKGHLAEMGGDFVSVNLNCIDGFDVTRTELVHWDGRHDNWQAGPRATPWPVAIAVTAAWPVALLAVI